MIHQPTLIGESIIAPIAVSNGLLINENIDRKVFVMRNWQKEAPQWISKIHADNPDIAPDVLRKVLRRHSQDFSCGTSWGAKVWAKHCKIYLARMMGGSNKIVTSETIVWPDDIVFPFRNPAKQEPNP